MTEPMIRLRKITKLFSPRAEAIAAEFASLGADRSIFVERYRKELALIDVDLDVAKGSIQVVMGLSGSGKSTLVRHINRLIDPTAGEVTIDGENILALSLSALRDFRRRRMSMVFQRFALFPHRTVEENVAYGLRSAGASRAVQREASHRWIDRVGLAGTEELYPAQLSGGMQQRVGLARALATDADILLMDEAFSALDPLIRTDMQDLLLDLQRDLGRTIVFITHDLDEALKLGDRIAILKDGEIVQEGTGQDIVLNPIDDYVQAFVGQVDRGRVLELGVLAGARDASDMPDPNATLLPLPASKRLAEASREIALAGAQGAAIVDRSGVRIGVASLAGIVRAMTVTSERSPPTAALVRGTGTNGSIADRDGAENGATGAPTQEEILTAARRGDAA